MPPRRPAPVVVLAAVLATAPAPPASAAEVGAGAIRIRVGDARWGVEVTDRRGRPVLAALEVRRGRELGPLGFRTARGWARATRVRVLRRSPGALVARVATSDPAGRFLRVSVARRAEGVLALDARVSGRGDRPVEAVGLGFRARPGERLLGFGERSNAVAQDRRTVENVVAEGPYQADELPVLGPFVPPWALRPRPEATYYPVPWLLSSAGYGVLVEDDEPSRFRLAGRRGWGVEVDGARLRALVIAGPRPRDALRRFTASTGRQPRVGPEVFGPWHHSEERLGDEEEILRGLRRRGVPLSVAQIYTQYLPCAAQRGREERQRARVRLFHAAGLAATTYVNPHLCPEHPSWREAVARGALSEDAEGKPYLFRFSVRRDLVAQFDVFGRAGRGLLGRLLAEPLRDGHDGWMEDYGEYAPPDAVVPGRSGPAAHNAYPRAFHCAAHAATARAGRPVVRYVRSGWTGSARCSPVVWGGDPTVGWGFDGLASALTNGLTMGLSGVSTWGSDIGGFFAFFERRLTPELLVRWIQLGAVSGVMRLQATGIAVPVKPRPQAWDPGVVGHWRRWARLRTQLFPYVEAADAEYRRSGLPIMRHLALVYRDRRSAATDDAFLFGPDLLAAPVVRPGARARRVHLPPGRWVDLWRSARYRSADGTLLLDRARVLRGGRSVRLPAPLSELPLLVRAGALLPLLPADVETLSAYGDRSDAVSLRERARRRVLLAFPRGSSSARVGAAGGSLVSREDRDGWELRIAGVRPVAWRMQVSLRTLRRPLRPCRVELGGRGLSRAAWRHRPAAAVLEVALPALRTARLRVRGRCG